MTVNVKITDYAPGFFLSVVLLFAALSGGLFFIYYFYVMGRPDLIMSVMIDSSIGFYIFFILLMLGTVAFVLQFAPSALLVLSCNILKESGISHREAVKLCTIHFVVAVVTALVFVLAGFYFEITQSFYTCTTIAITLCLVVYSLVFLSIRSDKERFSWSWLTTFVPVIVSFSTASWLFLLMLFFNVTKYSVFKEASPVIYIALGALCMVASLFPGFIWVKLEKANITEKFVISIFFLAMVAGVVLWIAPDMKKVVTFNVGKIVGLHSNQQRHYILNMDNNTNERLEDVWGDKMDIENGVLKGKTLFNFGGVELICPSERALNIQTMLDSQDSLGVDCMLLRSTDFMKGPLVQ